MTIEIGRTATSAVDLDAVPWVESDDPVYGKSSFKLVRCSIPTNTYTVIMRWGAGIVLPKHRHSGAVHAYTFEGKWCYEEYDWVATAGTYVHEPPGTTHTLKVLEDTTALFAVDGGQANLGPNDEVLSYFDTPLALEFYRQGLAAVGLELPEAILS
jgi:2,4'-dihydroxyacetophenone dioxygenase